MPVKFIATCINSDIAGKFKELCREEKVSQYSKLAEMIEGLVEAWEGQKKTIVVFRS